METHQDIQVSRLAEAWAELQAHAASGQPLEPNAYRLAFADPEFLLRRETRGLRIQLEMLKPDLDQTAAGIENTIVVFGSARFPAPDDAEAAMAAARTGGGPGIMEAATRGAHDVGAPSVALNIALPHEQSANPYVSPHLSFKFHYFAMRKMHFMMRAKALVAFPGGFGTLDELFEVITLVQTKKAKPVPIILFGSDYWKRLINMDVLIDEEAISPEDLALFQYVDDPQAAWDIIRDFYALPAPAG